MAEFRSIPGYEGLYGVARDGTIMAWGRKRSDGRFYGDRKLSPSVTANTGYLGVSLWKNGHYKRISIHRIVAQAYLAPIEGKLCVNHKDGDRKNNCLENLEWCTHSENSLDGFKRGNVIWNKGLRKRRSELRCAWCREWFIQKRVKQTFCSQKCASKHNGTVPKSCSSI